MRIQRTSQLITAAIVVSSLLAIVCALISHRYRVTQERAYEMRRRTSNLTWQLALGSDRLTAAVRAYAATGDPRRYEAFQRELHVDRNRDAAVEGLQQLQLTPEERALITRAKKNSDELVWLENQSFAAVATNNTALAIALVYGAQYETAKASIMEPIAECRRLTEIRLTSAAARLSARAGTLALISIAALILNAAATAAALLLFYRRRVVNPLAQLNSNLQDLVVHKPGAHIEYQDDNSEVGEVARLMETYRVTLAAQTQALHEAKIRIEKATASELRVAREIQMGMLPRDFATMEHIYGVSFGAVLEPAREVGGDLYGVCAAGPHRMLIFLGDVSGKGLAASMFMVRAISLARLLAREIAEPAAVLVRLNDELAADNPSGMFVTFLCAMFEPAAGRLVLANAGHCRPLLLPAGGGPPRWAVQELGTALGFESGLAFPRTELILHKEDTLILYSDGVSEAFNPGEELYGNQRLLNDAGLFAGQPPSEITAGLLRRVRAFAGSAPQSDDIAILALKVNGAHPDGHGKRRRLSLTLHATPTEVMRGVEALQEFAQRLGVPEKPAFNLALALEECGSNIVDHALHRDPRRTFHVLFEHTGDSVVLELRDDGPAFDPTTAPERPHVTDDEPPGGWGLPLVRRFMDEIHYRREDSENVLRLVKRFDRLADPKPDS